MCEYELKRRVERLEAELDDATKVALLARVRVLALESALARAKARLAEESACDARIAELEDQVRIEKGLRQSAEKQLAELKVRRAQSAVAGFDRKTLEAMRRLTHPDRHPGNLSAHRVTVEINRALNG